MSVSNTTIRIKKSTVSGNSPSTLFDGELAINQADGKLYYKTAGGSISHISNQDSFATIIANDSVILATGTTDTLNIDPGRNIDITACTTTKTITVATSPVLNVFTLVFSDGTTQSTSAAGASIDSWARDAANNAQANTVYLFGALDQTNTDIVSANTQLKAYTDGAIALANTQLKSYTDGAIVSANTQMKSYVDAIIVSSQNITNAQISHLSEVNDSQNNRINIVEANTIYLFGALEQTNSNLVSANTQLKSYVDGAIDSANVQLKSYTDGVVNNLSIYVGEVNDTQNTRLINLESNTVYLFGALDQTNTVIISANTQLKSYVDGAIDSANNWLQANDAQTLLVSKTYTDNSNTQLKSYSDGTFYQKTGGNITGQVTISSDLTVTGNLTVSGNVTTVSANNLVVQDNMIYLNSGNKVANPDLGIAGNYNDGTYHHAGFFRDASDGVWKVFDNYKPEPDATPYIDTSNSTFRIASLQANTLSLTAPEGTPPLSIVSSNLVVNLNADYLDGHDGSYYSPLTFTQESFNAANNALSYSNQVDNQQNTRISIVEANTIYLLGALTQTNTNVTGATTLAQAAYNQANTVINYLPLTGGTLSGTLTVSKASGASWLVNAKTAGYTNDSGIWSDASNNLQLVARNSSNTIAVLLDSNPSACSYINSGNFGIGTSTPAYKLQVNGSFAATTKSFLIDHPTKSGKKLRYGSLEGPENGVYVRGRLDDYNTIELPEYWTKLVDADSISVQLTSIGKHQNLYVKNIIDNKIIIAGCREINCFYIVYAERIDVEKLKVEIE